MTTKLRKVGLWLAALFFIFSGFLHFVRPAPYIRIVPPWIPWHAAMVYISGAAEIAGGAGLLIPVVRRMAAWGLVALLIAVFPANIYMAAEHIQFTAHPISPALIWARLLLQPLFIWWVWVRDIKVRAGIRRRGSWPRSLRTSD
ncbi:MAG TPA: DoxX family protein [Bryobacteraceae bacterium]|nr:DoxX family protein [Bryobacteraceae bacterium]